MEREKDKTKFIGKKVNELDEWIINKGAMCFMHHFPQLLLASVVRWDDYSRLPSSPFCKGFTISTHSLAATQTLYRRHDSSRLIKALLSCIYGPFSMGPIIHRDKITIKVIM